MIMPHKAMLISKTMRFFPTTAVDRGFRRNALPFVQVPGAKRPKYDQSSGVRCEKRTWRE
jgi:hypothetical protein